MCTCRPPIIKTQSISVSLCLSLFLCLSLSSSVCLSLPLSVSLFLCLSLSSSVCLSLPLSVSLSLCLSLSLPLSVSLRLSLSLSLSPSLSRFFKELEDIHQQNIVIDDISDIVFRHAQSNFDPYITYCSNEVYQQRTLQRLVSKSPVFKEVLTRIEGHPDCRNLPMISFLILPMQRVTRLPLLMDVSQHTTLRYWTHV
uniref:DH domain-containing protein n=1 Tax=Hucho hucho TaxID=62062 RepID=A0A4W5NWT4_9TELE